MSLKRKIIFSFFISAFIIAFLAIFEYINFVQIKGEMRFLELSDTIRSKSLQLRRHEKNFFLYTNDEELQAIYDYLDQLEDIAADPKVRQKQTRLETLVASYKTRFREVLQLLAEAKAEFGPRTAVSPYDRIAPLIEANFLDRPGFVAAFLEKEFSVPPGHPLVVKLRKLDSEISELRKNGEDIIEVSKVIDSAARERAEKGIYISQLSIIAVFPLFLIIGLGTLFYISNDVVRRLKTLTDAVEKTEQKYMPSVPAPERTGEREDEVGVLIGEFSRMGEQLELWAEEVQQKNRELLESNKLAAIGRLASGVAHELNNPLNNIFLSVQVLKRKLGDDASIAVREIADDLFGQTLRVKGIVADLLEFAREREPQLKEVELGALISHAYEQVKKSSEAEKVRFTLDAPAQGVPMHVDPNLMERVFINLFTNAVTAMEGSGDLVVKVEEGDQVVRIWVSDTGKGMSEEDKERIFDPFFTKKEKGTGLGLAIVMNIVKKHHGTISVESEEGEGTAFEITLPRG